MRVLVLSALVATVLGVTGCAKDGVPVTAEPVVAPITQIAQVSALRPEAAIVFDRNWVVEEGVWYISDRDFPRLSSVFPGRSNGLLGDDDPRSIWVSGPGLYGKYPVRIERHDTRPPAPRHCEDVVEVPLRASGKYPVVMGSFETWSRSLDLDRGTYRVRLCVSGLDAAATEPEFDGHRYHVYSSTYRFQIWPAARRPAEIVRVGSDWARREHERVAHEVASD